MKDLFDTCILFFLAVFPLLTSEAQINFPTHSEFKYLKGNEATALSGNWINQGYDHSAWNTGTAPFRYGDGSGGSELTDMNGNYSTVFLRTTFTVADLANLEDVNFAVNWDDGFVIWVNGQEVLSSQAPTNRVYNETATQPGHESGVPEIFKINTSELSLVEGENTLAVYACNISLSGSSDFYFDVRISATPSIPVLPELIDTIGLTFSQPSGFYNSAFDLTVSTPIADANIVYTLDGSNPQSSASRIVGNASEIINIDPNSSNNRGTTPGVIVRASAISDGYGASKPTTQTFIFIDNVKTQTHPGWDWPTYNINNQVIDLDIDSDVVNSADYSDLFDDALLDISTLSIATDNANLFNSDSGIYVNAAEQGHNWERQCSVELINPNSEEGFTVNAGIRIRGGWSRHPEYRKHSLRLFFREKYGTGKLDFPLFEDQGSSKYDKIDLRSPQNYSWANYNREHNTFVREVFTRDSQKAADQPYTRSRYYHLYINGMYWGIYQSQERAEARFAADYLGGDKEDYDVIKINGENYLKEIAATDGTLDKWKEIFALTQKGFANNKDYFFLEGKDEKGRPLVGSEIYVDIDNLIDYMINIFYTGNYDCPTSAWSGNKKPNNMYAIGNRENKTDGFKFFVHDGEHTLMTGPSSGPGIGLYENRANLGDRTGDDKLLVTEFRYFHSQWLHHKLTANNEYNVRFADRANAQLTGEGIFTPEKCLERFNKRTGEIDMAIIGESARWGDGNGSVRAMTRNDDWLPELNDVRNNYFPFRTNIAINQLKEQNLFPDLSAPDFIYKGTSINNENIPISNSTSLNIKNPSSNGDIYYTLDGSDPRLIGGSISSTAKILTSGADISIPASATIMARIKNGINWSALKKVNFIAEQSNYNNFKVTELHYRPTDSIVGTDTVSGKNYEFIEFKNTGYVSAINLSGLIIDSAIYYEFPNNFLLAPQQFFVVAAKPKKFYDRSGMIASGNSKKSFSNSGEQILITNKNGLVVMDFTYSDTDPWSEEADGSGYSLVSVEENPTGNPNNYNYWRRSLFAHGSPFNNDIVLTTTEFALQENNSLYTYPNPTNDVLTISLENYNNVTLKLYSITGALVYSSHMSAETNISLTELNINHGIYMLSIESENFTETKKIIYSPF